MAKISEALASKITGSIGGFTKDFAAGMKGAFVSANPAAFSPIINALGKAFEQQAKETRRDREERRREKAFDEEKNSEQRKLFTDILKELKEINDGVKKLLKELLGDNKKTPWKETLVALYVLIKELIKNLGIKIAKYMTPLIESLKRLLFTVKDEVLNGIGRGLGLLFNGIKNLFKNVKLPAFLDDIFKGLRSSFDDVAMGLKLFFDDLKNLFKGAKPPAFLDDLFKGLKLNFDDFGRGIKLFLDDFKRVFRQGLDDLGKFLRLDDLATAFNRFKTGLLVNFAILSDEISGLGKSIKDEFLKITRAFTAKIDDAIKVIAESKIGKAISGLLDELALLFDNLRTSLSGRRPTAPDFKPPIIPDFKTSIIDAAKVSVPEIKVTELKVPEVEVKKITAADFSVGKITMPEVKIPADKVTFSNIEPPKAIIEAGTLGADVKEIKAAADATDAAKIVEVAKPLAKLAALYQGIKAALGPTLKFLADITDLKPLGDAILKVAKPLGVIIGVFDGISNALFKDERLKRLLEKSPGELLSIGDRLAAFTGGFLGSVFGIFDLLLDLMNIDLGGKVETIGGVDVVTEKRTVQGMVTDFLTKNIATIFNGIKTIFEFFGSVLTSESAMSLYKKVGELFGTISAGFSALVNFFNQIFFSETMLKVYDTLKKSLKDSMENSVKFIKGFIDLVIGLLTLDFGKIKLGANDMEAAIKNQIKNVLNVVGEIFTTLTSKLVEVIEDGVNYVIKRINSYLPASFGIPLLNITGRNTPLAQQGIMDDVDFLGDEDLGVASPINPAATAGQVGSILQNQRMSALEVAVTRAIREGKIETVSPKDFAALFREKRGLAADAKLDKEAFEEFKKSFVAALHTRRSPSAMDLFGQSAKYSRMQYEQSKQYFKSDLDYQKERAGLQDQFNGAMVGMYRSMLTGLVGQQGFRAQTFGAGYNIFGQQNMMQRFMASGTKLFGDQMGPQIGMIFNRLAGNYADQLINNTIAPALGMNAGQLSRSINNLVASRQFRPQIKAVQAELSKSRTQLAELEKNTGFSLAELIKAGGAKEFTQDQAQRYQSLNTLRQQIKQREDVYKQLKAQEKKYKDLALEDFIFGISGIPTGLRSFLGYEQGLEQMANVLGNLTSAPFAPLFGTKGALAGGIGGLFRGGVGGGTAITMPGGRMITPTTMYSMPGYTGGADVVDDVIAQAYAMRGSIGARPASVGDLYATLDAEDAAMGRAYVENLTFGDKLKMGAQTAMPLISYLATKQLGEALGVRGVLGNMLFTSVGGSMMKDLLGSLTMFGGQGIGTFSTMGSLGKAFGLQNITSASTFGELATGIGSSVNNLFGGNMAGNVGSLVATGGTKLLGMQGGMPYDFLGEGLAPTTISGSLGAGMQAFGAGMQSGASMAGFSEALSAGGAQAAGAGVGTGLAGLQAYSLAKGLSGGYNISKGFNYIVSAVAMIPGLQPYAALIGLAGAVMNRAFGRKPREATAAGVRGTIGETNTEIKKYEDWVRKGGWFRSTKRGTDVTDLEEESITAITGVLQAQGEATRTFAEIIGYNADLAQRTKSFSKDMNLNLLGLDEKGIQEAFTKMFTDFSDDMIKSIYGDVEKFRLVIGRDEKGQPIFEDLIDTMRHLAESTMVFDQTMRMLGFTADDLSATFRSKTLADLAGYKEELIGIFGGATLEEQRKLFGEEISGYFNFVYSDLEKAQFMMEENQRRINEQSAQMRKELEAAQITIPNIGEFVKVLDPQGMIDAEETRKKNIENFRKSVEDTMKENDETGLKLAGMWDLVAGGLDAFIRLEIEKQKQATSTENIVKDIINPFENYVGIIEGVTSRVMEPSSDFGTSGFSTAFYEPTVMPNVGGAQAAPTSAIGTAILSGNISTTPASGTLGFLAETTNMTGAAAAAGTAGTGSNPLFIDNSVTSTTSSPTTIVMGDDKIRDYHPILNSSERGLTYGYSLARS